MWLHEEHSYCLQFSMLHWQIEKLTKIYFFLKQKGNEFKNTVTVLLMNVPYSEQNYPHMDLIRESFMCKQALIKHLLRDQVTKFDSWFFFHILFRSCIWRRLLDGKWAKALGEQEVRKPLFFFPSRLWTQFKARLFRGWKGSEGAANQGGVIFLWAVRQICNTTCACEWDPGTEV